MFKSVNSNGETWYNIQTDEHWVIFDDHWHHVGRWTGNINFDHLNNRECSPKCKQIKYDNITLTGSDTTIRTKEKEIKLDNTLRPL